jgi:drug/metabolite transporter (DMT)-like permease
VEVIVGLLTALLGLAFIATPWLFSLTSNTLASTAVIAGGLIVTLYGLGLVREARRKYHVHRPRH